MTKSIFLTTSLIVFMGLLYGPFAYSQGGASGASVGAGSMSGSASSLGAGTNTAGSTGANTAGSPFNAGTTGTMGTSSNINTAGSSANTTGSNTVATSANTLGTSANNDTGAMTGNNASTDEKLGILGINGTLPTNATVVSMGDVVSINQGNSTVTVRDTKTGQIYTRSINDAQMLQKLNEGDHVQLFSQP